MTQEIDISEEESFGQSNTGHLYLYEVVKGAALEGALMEMSRRLLQSEYAAMRWRALKEVSGDKFKDIEQSIDHLVGGQK